MTSKPIGFQFINSVAPDGQNWQFHQLNAHDSAATLPKQARGAVIPSGKKQLQQYVRDN